MSSVSSTIVKVSLCPVLLQNSSAFILISPTQMFSSLKRCASSAAHAKAAAPRVVRAPEAVRVSTSSSGLKVATLENHSPVSRVAAVVKTGARDEAQNQLGASHALRVFSSLVNKRDNVNWTSENSSFIPTNNNVYANMIKLALL